MKTKSKINGFSAQLTERLRTTKYLGNNENISISYTKNNLSLFASYFHNKQQGVQSENHFFNLKEGNNLWQHWSDMPKNKYGINTQQITSGFDLSINEEHAIGGQYQFYTGNTHLNFPIISNSQLNGEPYDLATSFSFTKDKSQQHLVNAFYNGDLSETFSIRIDMDYLRNHNDKDQFAEEKSDSSPVNIIEIFNQTDYDLYAGKLISRALKSSFYPCL